MIECTLLNFQFEGIPPTVNHMYMSRRGRRFKTEETAAFQENIVAQLKTLWNRPPFCNRAGLYLYFFQADRRHWDIDNRVKSIQDCLQKANVIRNDSQIDFLYVERVRGAENDITRLILTEIISAK